MASPLTVKRNDYHTNKKKNDIKTPYGICDFLAELLYNNISGKKPNIFDVGCGDGRLAGAFKNCITVGIDDRRVKNIRLNDFIREDFFQMQKESFSGYVPSLVLCNPPFNNIKGRKLMPEIFLKKIFELFGEKVPVVLFAPMGFRLNNRTFSKRYEYFRDDCKAEITSIISMPLDVFPDVEFHNEILIWNVKGLKAHYWLPEEYLYMKKKS